MGLLAHILAERGESLAAFGKVLAATIALDRQPFTKQYIYRLKSGDDEFTPEIMRALDTLAAMMDGVSELQARARECVVLAVNELPPNTVVMGKAKNCALPGCRVVFVPASPAQRYCSPECRDEMRSRRRQDAVKAA